MYLKHIPSTFEIQIQEFESETKALPTLESKMEKKKIKAIKHATLDYAFHIRNLFFNYTKILH